ncbi:MAG TPA: transcription antitermination factor NusB [Phycisphaerae bacterium]|nr:transcription antitermination factor NusB [Phycisphaerae bacterium]HRY69363.1 transcription antitermination factor NusB [Phycisphaerae bacterium]HSA26230.1 transcription antitermination factor NusB [Phycisphaerae bacterium]
MKHQRYQARTIALQGLYQLDIQRLPDDQPVTDLLAPLLVEAALDGGAAEYARELTGGAWATHARYDQMITEAGSHWDVSRMAVVDRNILRLALYELIEKPDVPARVIIDQAVELGREFGAAETPQFINGVLDAIWKRNPACQMAREARPAGRD